MREPLDNVQGLSVVVGGVSLSQPWETEQPPRYRLSGA